MFTNITEIYQNVKLISFYCASYLFANDFSAIDISIPLTMVCHYINFSSLWLQWVAGRLTVGKILMVYAWWVLCFPFLWLQKDSLMDLSFHVPTSNTQFIGDENRTSAQVRLLISSRWPKHMYAWCKSVKYFLFRCYGKLSRFKLMVVAPRRLLLLHLMELQFLRQGGKTLHQNIYCNNVFVSLK